MRERETDRDRETQTDKQSMNNTETGQLTLDACTGDRVGPENWYQLRITTVERNTIQMPMPTAAALSG